MAKISLTNIASTLASSLITAFNNNNAAIRAAIENTLSRDGTSPNEMNAQLDMNSNRIINLPEPVSATEPVRYGEFQPFVDDLDTAVAGVEALYDSFDDRYLGAKAVLPTVDNDGNTLLVGAIVFYTVDSSWYAWNGSTWVLETSVNKVTKTGDTMSGELNMQDNLITRPVIKDYALKRTAPAIAAGVLTVDFTNGNVFEISLDQNVSSIVVNNWPPTGELGKMHLLLKQDGTGGRTVAFSGYHWPNSVVPTVTPTANKMDIFVLMSPDAGSTIYATTAGQNY